MSKLDDLAEQAKKLAEDSIDVEEAKKLAAQLGEEAAVFVRKYPLQSVLGAAVAGFLLGSAWGKRK